MKKLTDLQYIRAWFGERGIDIYHRKNLKFEIYKGHLFILGIEYEDYDPTEVYLYELESICAEIYTGWPAKGFKWEQDNYLQLLIKAGLLTKKEQEK